MSIIYSDPKSAGGYAVDYHSLNAVKGYIGHYGNFLTLDFIAKTTKDPNEKRQALKELAIAERKMGWWEKHPNFVKQEAFREVERLKAMWANR
jgi:hypothetical protein